MSRYLHYPIDKRQSSPELRDDFPDNLKADCDDGYDVVVDLHTQRRYFRGEWAPVQVVSTTVEKVETMFIVRTCLIDDIETVLNALAAGFGVSPRMPTLTPISGERILITWMR